MDDLELRIAPDEEVLGHYIVELSPDRFLIYPLRECVHFGRGLIVTCIEGKVTSVRKTKPPPTNPIRPGISPQRQLGVIKDILFLGGNEEKMCHVYNLESDTWA